MPWMLAIWLLGTLMKVGSQESADRSPSGCSCMQCMCSIVPVHCLHAQRACHVLPVHRKRHSSCRA